jgi:hypothetical protein
MSEQKTETLSNVAIDSDIHKQVKIHCAKNGITVKLFVEGAVFAALAKVQCKAG